MVRRSNACQMEVRRRFVLVFVLAFAAPLACAAVVDSVRLGRLTGRCSLCAVGLHRARGRRGECVALGGWLCSAIPLCRCARPRTRGLCVLPSEPGSSTSSSPTPLLWDYRRKSIHKTKAKPHLRPWCLWHKKLEVEDRDLETDQGLVRTEERNEPESTQPVQMYRHRPNRPDSRPQPRHLQW